MDRQPPLKRPRLSMACNICRQRKVKCDADYPKCRNCRLRNQTCVTTDPQRPGCAGVREWLEVPEKTPLVNPTDRDSQNTSHNHNNDADASPIQGPNQDQGDPASQPHEANILAASDDVSPVHQPFDTSVNVELGTNRRKVLGGSSSQCLAKSLDLYFKTVRMKPVSGFFRYGMRHAEELDLPLTLLLPDLPEPEARERYVAAYRIRIQPMYPVVQIYNLQPGLAQLATVADFRSLPAEKIPILVMTYLILSLGVDEIAQCSTEEGDRYLRAAASLLAHVIVIPYLPAVQALLLFTMAYRARNQEGLAWQTLGMAIRIAYTLGIHRVSTRPPEQRNLDEQELHARVWATCCCLEATMHLDSGRPASISDDDHFAKPDSLGPEYRYTRWHLGLAEYQRSISHHIYNHHRAGTRSVRQILLDTARLDRALLSWANEIPPELRPGNDIFCAREESHIVSFLSIQYHAAMIALHRAALIAPPATFEAEVRKHCPEEPSQHRLANGESICVNSARAIAKLSIELPDRETDSCLIPAGPAMLACIVLAIYLMKHPGSRLQAMDLQLLKACTTYASAQMAQSGTDPRFMEGFAVIYDQVRTRLEAVAGSDSDKRENGHQRQQNMSSGKRGDFTPRRITNTQPGIHTSHGLGHKPAHEERTPMTRVLDDGYRSQLGRYGQTLHPSPGVRPDPYSLPDPVSRPVAGDQWHPPVDQRADIEHDIIGFPETNGFMGELASDAGNLDAMDSVFPFEGFNVEDLWNWMLYLDSPRSVEGLE